MKSSAREQLFQADAHGANVQIAVANALKKHVVHQMHLGARCSQNGRKCLWSTITMTLVCGSTTAVGT